MEKFSFTFERPAVEYILKVLGKEPFNECASICLGIQSAINAQLKAAQGSKVSIDPTVGAEEAKAKEAKAA